MGSLTFWYGEGEPAALKFDGIALTDARRYASLEAKRKTFEVIESDDVVTFMQGRRAATHVTFTPTDR